MNFYTVYEGEIQADDLSTNFKSLERAIKYARKLTAAQVVVHEYSGRSYDDNDYVNTHFEKKDGKIILDGAQFSNIKDVLK